MDRDTLLNQVCNDIASIAETHGIQPSRAFAVWFAMSFYDLSAEEALDAASIDGANDKGIDLFFVDDAEKIVIVAQCKYSERGHHNPRARDIDTLYGALDWLAAPEVCEREGKAELAEAARDYQDALGQDYAVELWYTYMGDRDSNIDRNIQVHNEHLRGHAGSPVIHSYDLELLLSTYDEVMGHPHRVAQDSLQFVDGQPLALEGAFGRAVVVTVPASELVRLHKAHGDQLFDRNVRRYLGARKRSVNAGISETVNDRDRKGSFWAYNNGITFVCSDMKVTKGSVALQGFSIVNGCQTTVVLAENADAVEPDVRVLVRIIAPPEKIIDDITRYTNSQNPVRTWDIASQHPTQRRLKKGFQELSPPWLYNTQRGSRPRGQDLDPYRGGPDGVREMKIDSLGQYMAAYHQEPTLAYKNKAFIFDRHHERFFPRDITVEKALFVWVCGELCREVAVGARQGQDTDDVRILKKGGHLFALAVLSEVVRWRNGSTFLVNTGADRIASSRTRDKLRQYAQYSVNQYLRAVRDLEELESAELPTLLRQRNFFDRMLSRVETQYRNDEIDEERLAGILPTLFA